VLVTPSDDIRLISLDGELDLSSSRRLAASLSEAVGDSTRRPLVDLTAVTFVDSTALGALVRASRQLRRQGRSLSLAVAQGPVTEILEMSGTHGRFTVYDSRDAALEAMNPAAA
jgi:anti-sigma B factor antagonist